MLLIFLFTVKKRSLNCPNSFTQVSGRDEVWGTDPQARAPTFSCICLFPLSLLCFYLLVIGPHFRLLKPLSSFSLSQHPFLWPTLPHQTCWLSPGQSICVFWIGTGCQCVDNCGLQQLLENFASQKQTKVPFLPDRDW